MATNSLGITEMSLDEVKNKYGIDASKEYAKQVAEKQLSDQMATLTTAKQGYEADAYGQSKKKDLDYFDQFRTSQYSSAGRGLAGGLERAGMQQLNMARNNDLADIYTNLSAKQAGLDTQGRQYKDAAVLNEQDIWQQNLSKAQSVIDSDFSKRFQVAQEEFNRKMQEQQLALQRASAARSGSSKADEPMSAADEVANLYDWFNDAKSKGVSRDQFTAMARQSGYSDAAVATVMKDANDRAQKKSNTYTLGRQTKPMSFIGSQPRTGSWSGMLDWLNVNGNAKGGF